MIKATATITRLRRNGCKRPIYTYQEAKRAGIPVSVLAAVLDQESGGGKNVFGHDRDKFGHRLGGIPESWTTVTKQRYLFYKEQRHTKGMQGVGPMQLTWYAFQDQADRYGGCWVPKMNIRVGAEMLRDEHKLTKNWWSAFWRYNGSQKYANQVEGRRKKWAKILGES
jgi:hypothetical protein